MSKLTLKTLLERKLTKKELSKREEVANKLEKGDGWTERYGKRGKAVKMAVATIIAKKKMKKSKKKVTESTVLTDEDLILEGGDIINKDNVPMSRAEIAARDKCYKSKRHTLTRYFKTRRDGRTDTGKERRARVCSYYVLRSTRKGKGGALKSGAFGAKKKYGKTASSKNKSGKKGQGSGRKKK